MPLINRIEVKDIQVCSRTLKRLKHFQDGAHTKPSIITRTWNFAAAEPIPQTPTQLWEICFINTFERVAQALFIPACRGNVLSIPECRARKTLKKCSISVIFQYETFLRDKYVWNKEWHEN